MTPAEEYLVFMTLFFLIFGAVVVLLAQPWKPDPPRRNRRSNGRAR